MLEQRRRRAVVEGAPVITAVLQTSAKIGDLQHV
jgi:hypothetical protein